MEKSKAKEIKILIKKYQGLLKKHFETANFKEPVLFLMQRNGKVTFYENATAGEFVYEHSDKSRRYINLTGRPYEFDYGRKGFKGYICHEDFPYPLPEQPELSAEVHAIAIDKAVSDLKKWKEKEIRAKTDMYKTIGFIIIGLILAFAMYKLLVKGNPEPMKTIAKPIVNNIPTPTILK